MVSVFDEEEWMRYSIAKLLLATVAVNVIVCLSFATPVEIGFPILTFISLFLLPPALVVAIINTRSARQAFFVGCMVAGIGHFVMSIYLFIIYIFDASSLGDISDEPIRYLHIVGYSLSLVGGLSGVGMFRLVQPGLPKEAKANLPSVDQPDGALTQPLGSNDDRPASGQRDARKDSLRPNLPR